MHIHVRFDRRVYKYLRHFKPLILLQAAFDFFFRFLSRRVNGYIFAMSADFHVLSPRDFHNHSPTPGFCFLSF
jgi:hypothetical protein